MEDGVFEVETQKSLGTVLRHFLYVSISLIFYEIVLLSQLKGLQLSSLFFLFFIPAEALFFTSLCGIGGHKSTRITLPVILFISSVYYIIQTVYITNFGTLFSISMAEMGTTAMGDFGWALTDSIVKSIPRIILLLLPTIISILCLFVNPVKSFMTKLTKGFFTAKSYKWFVHLIVFGLCIIMWFVGVGGIRLFGDNHSSPYYLYSSNNATSDATAHKLGVLTTAVVEGNAYFFGKEAEEEDFIIKDDEFIASTKPQEEEIIVVKVDEENYEKSQQMQDGEVADEEQIVEEEESIPWVNEMLDFDKVKNFADNETTKSLAEFVANREPSTQNEMTGMFEGYNLIYICAESFWNYACNEKVTPTLYKMANNGIVLNNYYNSFFNTTTNGEYAFCTGLWPDVSRNSKNGTDVGSFAQSASRYMPQGLGDLFTQQGIGSYAFHNYYGKYYRRILSWPNLGYNCRFTGDGMWFTSNWPASDLELVQKTVDDYISDEQFNVYYMTFSGHGPFTSKNYMFNKNIGEVTSILGEDEYNLDARGYFCGELELDKAMEYLLGRLEEAGVLDKTVIVLAADHYPYYLSDEGLTSLTKNGSPDMDFDIYKSSCIIYNAGMKEPMYVDDYCSNIDIAPTILNLFNIPFESRLFMGRDIFSNEAHKRATLYNMNFITDMVRYNYEKGEAAWSEEGNKMSDEEKDRYIEAQLANIENEYNVSCKFISENFFLKAYEACGLLTPEEIAMENEREQSVRDKDEAMNAEDEAKDLADNAKKAQEAQAAQDAQAALEAQLLQNAILQQQAAQNQGVLPQDPAAVPQAQVPPAQDGAAAPAETIPVVQ